MSGLLAAAHNLGASGYWPLDEPSGSALDRSGNARHLPLYGSMAARAVSTPYLGRATTWAAGGSFYSVTASWNNMTSASTVIWYRTANAGANHKGMIVKPLQYGLFLYSNALAVYDWNLNANHVVTGTMNDGLWHMAVATQQSGVTNGSKVYSDGVLMSTFTSTSAGTDYQFVIGGGGYSSTANPPVGLGNQEFTGDLAHGMLFNRIITLEEVSFLFNTARRSGVVTGG